MGKRPAKPRQITNAATFRDELERRSGFGSEQLLGLAMRGDAAAIGKCAGVAAGVLQRAQVKPDLADLHMWAVDVLRQIGNGAEPNHAFGWVRTGRRGRARTFETTAQESALIQSMAVREAENPKLPLKTIAGQVAEMYRGTRYEQKDSTILKLYQRFKREQK